MASDSDDMATHVLAGTVPTLELASVELVVVDGKDRALRHALPAGRTRVGTAAGNDLTLSDPTISRFHCVIDLRREGVRVVDSGSTNGTFVDSVRVYDAALVAGSNVRIGATTLRVEISDEHVYVPISARDQFGGVIGGSVEMRRVYAIIERVGPTEATVLIQGETGTGKELVARAIHSASPRKSGPFVAIDCGAIAESLIESELFGHVRGAFSGAVADRKGLFEEAEGGTLLLDEIGELPMSLQPKLLRAIETREVRRVGSNAPRAIDARILAATNRPLAQAINEGTFREDLYYRLAVVELSLPPLRARREDIPLLAQHFFERFSGDGSVPPELIRTLLTRSWPGNVRELRNFVERSVSLGLSGVAPARPLIGWSIPPGAEAFVPAHLPLKEARPAWNEAFEALYVKALLQKTGNNVTKAAELAQIHRRTLQRLMAAVGVRNVEADEADDEAES